MAGVGVRLSLANAVFRPGRSYDSSPNTGLTADRPRHPKRGPCRQGQLSSRRRNEVALNPSSAQYLGRVEMPGSDGAPAPRIFDG
jgi:hypothetical protein